jgi:hypothetical protein
MPGVLWAYVHLGNYLAPPEKNSDGSIFGNYDKDEVVERQEMKQHLTRHMIQHHYGQPLFLV